MLLLLDTSVAIYLRDLHPAIIDRIGRLDRLPLLSVLTLVELEGGVAQSSVGREQRRRSVDAMVEAFQILSFGPREAAIYGQILSEVAFSRSRIIDRMIAAQAIAADAALATMNPRDFRSIPGLRLEDWTA